jgi:ABC-type multidrug transport system fused ATPase/permease subunit
MKEKDELRGMSYLDRMKESLSVYSWVVKETVPKESRKHVWRMLTPMFFYEIFGMAIPLCFGFIVDAILQKDTNGVLLYFGGIFAFMVFRLILHFLHMREREYIKSYNEVALSDFITRGLMEKSIGQHSRHKEDLSQSSMNRARQQIRYLTSLMLFQGISSTYSLLMSFVFIWFLAPFAGAVLTVALGLYLFGSLVMNKFVVEEYTPIDDDFKDHNDKLEEVWDKAPRILSLGRGADMAAILKRNYGQITERSINFWIRFIQRVVLKDLVNVVALIIVWGAYIYWALNSTDATASVGFLVPLFSWSWSVVNNIWRIGHIEHEFNWCLPSVRKLKNALSIKPDIVDNNPTVYSFQKTPKISFENVSFDHLNNGSVKQTIKDMSFEINPGDKLALIGMSGAGKSTLASLIQRAIDPKSGKILVDGENLRNISVDAWSNMVGEIPQEIEMFQGALRENLLMGIHEKDRHLYPDEHLQEVMREFAIDFCKEQGLDTEIGPKGVRLSGGQRQRVAIVQIALKRESNMYLIDEATSSLDPTTEKEVQDGFKKLLKGNKSAVVIAHNLSTVRNICNKFIVLRPLDETPEGESQIEAQGDSFEEILPKSPTLKRLMDDQGLLDREKKVLV